jgi:uncharacterized protein (DUF1697 family)
MSAYIALLRGINVGGHNSVPMSKLRDLFADLGFSGAKTLLQSGNVVFDGDGRTGKALEELLEKETAKRLGVSADYLVRSAAELAKIIAANPFHKEANADPSHLLVVFLKTAATPAGVKALQASIKGPEVIHARGKHLYIVYPAGIGRSKLTGALIEQKLASRGTARNWNTIQRLLALSNEAEESG